jgi:glutamyl-tRNA synthetase
MILGADGAKLSKRHGAFSVLQYQEEGFLPDAMLNYLVRLGWSHGDQEVFTREEMIAAFDLAQVGKAAAAFDPAKLLWLNQQHMMKAPLVVLAAGLKEQLARIGVASDDQALLEGVANALRERARTLKDMAASSLYFFRDFEAYDAKAAAKNLDAESAPLLQAVADGLKTLPAWNAGSVHELISGIANVRGVAMGKVAQPLRVAVTGGAVSPPIDLTVVLLGRETCAARLARAIAVARGSAA